jgi:hypothetical protein
VRLVLAAVALAAMAGCNLLGGAPAAEPYKCGDYTGNHCYATGTLGSHVTGFRTTITVASNFRPGDGFLTNEFWLNNFTGVKAWLEVGYKTDTAGRLDYFWGILDPTTAMFTAHELGVVPAEEVGTPVVFDIHQTADGEFLVSVEGSVTHVSRQVSVQLWSGASGGWVSLGQELAGKQGAQAALTTFTHNQVYDAAFTRRPVGAVDRPSESADAPPFGGWLLTPDGGNVGEVFATHCCAP